MYFPSEDKLLRAKAMVVGGSVGSEKFAGEGIEETDPKYWTRVCHYYQNILGGKEMRGVCDALLEGDDVNDLKEEESGEDFVKSRETETDRRTRKVHFKPIKQATRIKKAKK